jgi:hypothetical protein
MTLHYTLTISGPAAELDTVRTYSFDCFEVIPEFGDNPFTPTVEFKVVEPNYRVKTLAELVLEYGEIVIVGTEYGEASVRIGQHSVPAQYLGDTTYPWSRVIPSDAAGHSIFLKEIIE